MVCHRSPRPNGYLMPALLACLFLLLLPPVACSGELSDQTGTPHPELRLPDLQGQEHDLEEMRGKVVLVNFWASWCTPCMAEMPSIGRLLQHLKGRPFAVLGVNVGEGERRVQAVARRLGLEFPVLLDGDSSAFKRWGATVLPTTYVIDPTGAIRHVGRGPLAWDDADIIAMLEGLMAEPIEH